MRKNAIEPRAFKKVSPPRCHNRHRRRPVFLPRFATHKSPPMRIIFAQAMRISTPAVFFAGFRNFTRATIVNRGSKSAATAPHDSLEKALEKICMQTVASAIFLC
jgi:hypothetical protein